MEARGTGRWLEIPAREGFIGKEKDSEDNLGDFGVRKYDESLGRFMSTDVLWEKYRGLTPYQYGGNNPINTVDRNGQSFKFVAPPGEMKEFIRQFYQALRYLRSAGVSGPLDNMEKSTQVFTIQFSYQDADEWRPNRTILWNPYLGYTFADGTKRTAALLLLHEAYHGEDEMKNRKKHFKRVATEADDRCNYPNAEEERVVKKENEAAKKALEGIRPNYYDIGVVSMESSTSTVQASKETEHNGGRPPDCDQSQKGEGNSTTPNQGSAETGQPK